MLLNIVLPILGVALLVFFLKLLNDLSSHYHSLLETQRSVAGMLQQRKKADAQKREVREKQRLAEELVDQGSSAVETVHKMVSGITFGILESTPITGSTSKVARQIHDEAAEEVYGTIRTLGKRIGRVADAMLPWDSEATSPTEPDSSDEES
jgi:uncharacterized protein YoxC